MKRSTVKSLPLQQVFPTLRDVKYMTCTYYAVLTNTALPGNIEQLMRHLWSNLELKTWLKELFGYLPLDITFAA
jgi:hypothetical protein